MNIQYIGGIIKSDVKLNKTKTSNKSVLNLRIQTKDKSFSGTVKMNNHNIKLWGSLAEMVSEHYNKGDYIIITGRSETYKHNDKLINETIVTNVENYNIKITNKEKNIMNQELV